MFLYDKVKVLAEKQNLSINQLEKKCELSSGSISKWNKSQPSAIALYKVAKYFGISVENMLEEKTESR